MTMEKDIQYMQQALTLARAGLGRVWPNPSVGCLVVRDRKIIGRARTADGGRPHAETEALAEAGKKAKGATLYVTLEPCNTHGKTPPCVDAVIKADVQRVVIACRDPYQKKAGGIERLRKAGIEVVTGVCEEEAQAINEGFFKKVTEGRPLVTAKLATSLDGRIATRSGKSKWITGEKSRRRGHELRASHDAVLVGIRTALADDPLLTVRLPEHDGPQPVRIVIDKDFKLPYDSRLARTAGENPVWVITQSPGDEPESIRRIVLKTRNNIFVPADILRALAEEGITRLLIEGGGETITHFLKAGMVDRLAWFRAPKIIGGDGVPGIGPLGADFMEDIPLSSLEESVRLDEDSLEIWRLKKAV